MLHSSNTMIVIHMGRGMVWHGMAMFHSTHSYILFSHGLECIPPTFIPKNHPHPSIHPSIRGGAMACHHILPMGVPFHSPWGCVERRLRKRERRPGKAKPKGRKEAKPREREAKEGKGGRQGHAQRHHHHRHHSSPSPSPSLRHRHLHLHRFLFSHSSSCCPPSRARTQRNSSQAQQTRQAAFIHPASQCASPRLSASLPRCMSRTRPPAFGARGRGIVLCRPLE